MAGLSQEENETEFQRNGPGELRTMVRRTCVQLLISKLKPHKLSPLCCNWVILKETVSGFGECSDQVPGWTFEGVQRF